MCGIVGVVYGPNGAAAEDWTPAEAAELMFPNVVHRGRDAFGWLHTKADGHIQIRKFAESATAGLDKVREDHRFGIPKDAKFWIGHVRFATHGHQSYTHNNHPIVHGDIMGVHNGVCYNYSKVLEDTGRQHKKAEVDSEAIFAAINKYGVVPGLDQLDALAAVVFINRQDPSKVYFATCDANPLILARSKGGATYFASESWILDALGIEWDEEPWKMDDYTLHVIENGVAGEYVQYADPKEKQRSGYGSNWYGSYNTNTPRTSSYGGGTGGYASRTYGTISSEPDDGYPALEYDPQTGRMTAPGAEPASTFIDEVDLECLNCNWGGDEWEAEMGECPLCGSCAYLVPKGMFDREEELARTRAIAEVDQKVLNGELPMTPWQEDLMIARQQENKPNDLVVVADGTVMAKEDYDARATAIRMLHGEGSVI